ncbi:GNAT family N-acetyltransferase [Microbacterium hydrocarbonoxydans]|uniref:GNAT family N-acetyltransferase n=1 Tax=Microbacterium hydrocarbonoxydans TaxID=273678 RepID=UPI0013DD58A0|nr:GNAT family N-acetyltransferase [Microbacterium hydrocarbonoxydans]
MTTSTTSRLLSGPAGAVVHTIRSSALGRIDFEVLDPVAELDLLHTWVTRPTSRFWGLGALTHEELRDLYLHVDSLPSHHAFLVRRDGLPIVLLQTYEPESDPVGEVYDARPGDAGVHLLIGDRGAPVPGFSTHVADLVAGFVFAHPAVDRLVIEPDVGNERAVARAVKSGFELGPRVQLPDKTGQLAFLTRERWERMQTERG